MLTQIKLTNFKCFKEETTFPLSKFNLFTGVNGAGKSTALQPLILICQSTEFNTDPDYLTLNGNCINLGNFDDIRNCENSKDNPIVFEITHSDLEKNISIKYFMKPQSDENETNLLILDEKNNENTCPLNYGYHQTYFISADRIGPQEFYQKFMLPADYHVGTKGEFTVHLLNKFAEDLVDESLCMGEDARTLITQTKVWLGKILNPLSLATKLLGKTNFLELLIGGFKPSNVGFGYSSILPIIVTGLIAKPDEKIIIENPEIHLHPKAQSALVEFLVKVANTGVQIFIESHSDHILNALRIAVKNQAIKPDDVNILFFTQENQKTKVIKPTIDENGRINQWVEDFFDESAKSLASLVANQRPRIKAPKVEP